MKISDILSVKLLQIIIFCSTSELTVSFSLNPSSISVEKVGKSDVANESKSNKDVWISPPISDDDWKGVASLIIKNFETPSDKKDNVIWNLVWKPWLEWSTYRRYIKTARKLKGMKNNIFVAKHIHKEDQIVGMVEVGMTVRPPNGIVVPTMGVLCVDPEFQRCGIGSTLVYKTEQLVQNVWNITSDTSIHVEIETDNPNSLSFFKSRGYQLKEDNENNVNVLEKGILIEKKPCWVVTKTISEISNDI